MTEERFLSLCRTSFAYTFGVWIGWRAGRWKLIRQIEQSLKKSEGVAWKAGGVDT
jgi:hypothetical protein